MSSRFKASLNLRVKQYLKKKKKKRHIGSRDMIAEKVPDLIKTKLTGTTVEN